MRSSWLNVWVLVLCGTASNHIQSTHAATAWESISQMGSSFLNQVQAVADSTAGVDFYKTGLFYSTQLFNSNPIQLMGDVSSYVIGLYPSLTTAPPQDVCYAGLGCFSMAYPWYSAVRPLPAPQSPADIGVQFHLYSRSSRPRTVVRSDVPYSIRSADYNGAKPTFFIVHGKADDGNATWAANMKDALLTRVDGNVIIVDWGKGARNLANLQVVSNTRVVGAVMITLANYLIQQKGANVRKMHLIGDGTGGHAAAYMGKAIPNIGRITGLDVDAVWFELYPDVIGLASSDALYVDLLHTSGVAFFLGGSGAVLPHGHKDFYVNGGAAQPGCPDPLVLMPVGATFGAAVNATAEEFDKFSSCSHARASQLFTASITNTCMFVGRAKGSSSSVCTAATCCAMGYDSVLYPATGVFNVAATQITPFCVRDAASDAAVIALQTQQGGG